MDTSNRHFHLMIHHLDPSGMLQVPINMYNNEKYLLSFYRTNDDCQELDVSWMCDQLIKLLANLETLAAISSSVQFLKTDFQRTNYSLMMVSQAFIGLIIVQENSVKAFYNYYENSKLTLFKNEICLGALCKKRNRKTSDPSYRPKRKDVIKRQNIECLNQNQVNTSDIETYVNKIDTPLVPLNIPLGHSLNTISTSNNQENIIDINRISDQQLSLYIQAIEKFPVSNENLITENPPLPRNGLEQFLVNIDAIQSENIEYQQAIEQPQNTINVQIQTEQLSEQPNDIMQLQEQSHLKSSENDPSQNKQLNQPLKRKKSREVVERKFKRRPIEQSSKQLKKQLKRLEGELPDRPFEKMIWKSIHQSMNHLPLRHAMYHNKLNIPFTVLTLDMELKENKDRDDTFNDEMNLSKYNAITEKLSNKNISNNCIYQQYINNSLPHLSLLSLAEEGLMNNSSVWRNTIDEINKKLDDSLKSISPISKVEQIKREEFREKIMQKINRSLIAQKSLIGPEISRTNLPELPILHLPLPGETNELINDNLIVEKNKSIQVPQVNIEHISYDPFPQQCFPTKSPNLIASNMLPIDQAQRNNVCSLNQIRFQNTFEPSEAYQEQSTDVMQMISNILLQSPRETSAVKFTELCPINITNRKKTISVFLELLRLHKRGMIKLSQSFGVQNPSSIIIKLN